MAYYPEFSRLLNQELQRQDRSASWLAHRLGVSPSTVARWLNHGTRPNSPEAVVRIADLLGMAAKQDELLVATGYGFQPGVDGNLDQALTRQQEVFSSSARERVSNLPQPSTPLVGRDAELAQLGDWLADPNVRLVTVVGPGGMGKTRLALAAGATQEDAGRFEHGVAFADLAPLSEVGQISGEIADAIGMPLESGADQSRAPEQQIVDYLRNRNLLLIVDNAEHLLDGAPFIAEIARKARNVQILVTSRVPLSLPDEQLFPLRGLDTVDEKPDDGLTRSAAMVLFLQSARRVRPDYGNGPAEQKQIIDICELVEGMPLAIELAAPWVTVMSAGDILSEIRRSLEILETDSPGIPERHRSMEAVFDATWQRLSAEEQQVFAQISVFRGGFTRQAVTKIADAGLRELRGLATLSLIVHDQERDRYAIHELLRQYGGLRLAEIPELASAAAGSHSAFYIDLLRRRQSALKSRGLQTDLQVLDAEVENLTQAWAWAASHDHVDGIVDTLDGLGIYLQWRGRSEEGVVAFREAAAALERTGRLHHRSRALAWQAHFAHILGENEIEAELLQSSQRILDDPSMTTEETRAERAFVLLQLGAAASGQNADEAQKFYQGSLALYEEIGDAWFAAEALLGLAHTSLVQGDFDSQRAYAQQALDTYRNLGNVRGTAAALAMLADIDSYRGRLMSGLELGLESLAIFRSLGDQIGTATSLARIGMTYFNLGDVTNARQVVSESATLFAAIGSRRDEVFANAMLCAAELIAGNYDQALAHAQRSSAFASELDDRFMLCVALGWEGWAQIYVDDLDAALRILREAVAIARQANATMDLTRALALLGYAQWQKGQHAQARAHCAESLRLAAQVGDTWSLLSTLSTAVTLLAGGEDPEKAVELHSMLMQDPLCAASRWFEDGVTPHVEAAMELLPDEVVEVARSRGASLDQLVETAKLADELSGLGWIS